jgi:dTMP kinase
MLIAIDGIDGAGKTTLAQNLKRVFTCLDPLIEKEPTEYSTWGKRLKESAEIGRLPRELELDYFHRDRVEHIRKVIKPALEGRRLVILDRYIDSTLAFQADDVADAEHLYERFLPEILVANFTFILDCNPEVGLERISRTRPSRSKFERIDTLRKAESIYRSRQGPTYHHVNAMVSVSETLSQVLAILSKHSPKLKRVIAGGTGIRCSNSKRRAEA